MDVVGVSFLTGKVVTRPIGSVFGVTLGAAESAGAPGLVPTVLIAQDVFTEPLSPFFGLSNTNRAHAVKYISLVAEYRSSIQ